MTILHNFINSSKRNLSILGIFVVLLFVSSCSSNEEMPDERLVEKELYDQAQTRLKNGSFSTAILSLEALESRFPFGRYAEQAQVRERSPGGRAAQQGRGVDAGGQRQAAACPRLLRSNTAAA